jgi:hypothetical protein
VQSFCTRSRSATTTTVSYSSLAAARRCCCTWCVYPCAAINASAQPGKKDSRSKKKGKCRPSLGCQELPSLGSRKPHFFGSRKPRFFGSRKPYFLRSRKPRFSRSWKPHFFHCRKPHLLNRLPFYVGSRTDALPDSIGGSFNKTAVARKPETALPHMSETACRKRPCPGPGASINRITTQAANRIGCYSSRKPPSLRCRKPHVANAHVPTALGLGGYPFVGNSEMAPFWLAPGGANFLLCLLSRRNCCPAYLLSKTQEALFWPCLSMRSTPFACLERAQRRKKCSRGLAGRFFLQRDWLHLPVLP